MKIFLILLSLTSVAQAEECSYQMNAKDMVVSWTAYKTPLKVGVGGKFDELGTKDQTADSLKELLEGINFIIKTDSTNTNNAARDKKIYTYFFQKMTGGDTITGRSLEYSKKILNVELNINKVTKIVPLKVSMMDSKVVAVGNIDVLDFNLMPSLQGINKACEKLHEGKTWNDVEISFESKYSKSCK